MFYSKEIFLQSTKFSTKTILDQRNFLQTRKFFTKTFFLDQERFLQGFLHSQKNISGKKDQKRSLKAKVLDPFNNKSYATTLTF